MARFPRTDARIAELALEMLNGFGANTAVYPSPPIDVAALGGLYSDYIIANNAVVAAQAAADQAYSDKDEALDALAEGMKKDIRYAENTVDFDDDKLKLIGWAGRKSPTPLSPPGQARLLEVPRQGEGWVVLDWKSPVEGGKPSAYKVMRRNRPDGAWQDVATAVASEATLVDQTRGVELEYRVVAVNKAGEGQASNTVMAVL